MNRVRRTNLKYQKKMAISYECWDYDDDDILLNGKNGDCTPLPPTAGMAEEDIDQIDDENTLGIPNEPGASC